MSTPHTPLIEYSTLYFYIRPVVLVLLVTRFLVTDLHQILHRTRTWEVRGCTNICQTTVYLLCLTPGGTSQCQPSCCFPHTSTIWSHTINALSYITAECKCKSNITWHYAVWAKSNFWPNLHQHEPPILKI